MSQEQAERARQMLYEDVSTRDELADDEAEILLKWGEAQVERLAAANVDDTQFEEAFAHLTKMLTRMNRFAARRAEQGPDEQQTSLSRIVESAAAAGLPVVQALAENFSAQAVPDTLSNLQSLIAMFAPAENTPLPTAIIPAEPHSLQIIEKTGYDEEEQQQAD